MEADVLVIGGGPAGAWAAIAATNAGAKVILADKGYCGSTGATAASGTSVLYVPPDPQKRQEAITGREKLAGYLADSKWTERVIEQTYTNMNLLDQWGFPFQVDEFGQSFRGRLSGPEYMRLMRKHVKKARVKILDHSPALELHADSQGVSGASGVHTITGEAWQVRANAVIIATGGCAFLSKSLGCNVLTGDGYLMAAEAGAEMSGMEFSNAYSISPAFASVTKSAYYTWATFYYEDGTEIEGAGGKFGRSQVARALIDQPVYARLDKATPEMQQWMRKAQPAFFLPFNRKGIDPFTQMFPITLRLEATVRGTGGIRITGEDCATSVSGLYAAGDAATRELICGAFTGGGSHNSAWAISSGQWSGESAAKYALNISRSGATRQGEGLSVTPFKQNEKRTAIESLVPELVRTVQDQVFPLDRNWFRSEVKLKQSLTLLDQTWKALREGIQLSTDPAQLVKAREAASMIATARWMYTAGLARTETRGMHRRDEFPNLDPAQQHSIITGGLDQLYTKPASSVPGRELKLH
ncbi:FAD-binding protein [Cohnella abietis]|uniref:Oxidoreductase n=1 Tax=Cohnella abietis TaxID=2507935 RepID=A0A3T1DD07_9BACL|nr:FAD-binding protein [Cohnella abietis]BBI35914.1 oxidoreductase [Cohnella abietis]